MVKLLLFSIVVATFVLPVLAARVREPRRAMSSLLLAMAMVEICYGLFLLLIYRRFA